jgi:class 3 adenylate cyclase
MRAWTVDADDIRIAEDFDESLLHRTPEIDAFLRSDRDEKFIVIGTKGFGKTLLLKVKRIIYQREGRAACLPAGALLDKPIGDKIFSRESIAFFIVSPLPWSKLWLTAIALATLKHFDALADVKVGPSLARLVADGQLRGVIDHFVRLLDFSPKELQRCSSDTYGHLVPRLRAVNSPVAIFIDGVDEYFNKHVEALTSHSSVTGELSPDVWHFAQLGLVEVAYQLRRINHHIKVFAAVRKEAYARLARTTVMSLQYRGSAIDIAYSPQSLREIFVNNIRLLKSDVLSRPERARTAPLEAFLGRPAVTDPYTHEDEEIFEYICRHTLLRPRDLMSVGERLSSLRPEERRSEQRLKEVVHQAAVEIAHEYLAEIAPHIGDLDIDRLLRVLPGNVLSREQVERLFLEHSLATGDEKHVFCALYRVGLLGYVHHDRIRGEWGQRFLQPGEATLERDGVLPQSDHYLVHPILSDLIGRVNPAYLQRVQRINIVGYGRPWRDLETFTGSITVHKFCVLKGDVHGFGKMMRAGTDGVVRQALENAVAAWGGKAVLAKTGGGDSLLIIDDDPVALAQAARHIIDEVFQATGQPLLRMALHYGDVQMQAPPGDGPPSVVGGSAILCAARVEPYVLPGQIWATEHFRERITARPTLWRMSEVLTPDGLNRFNVKKPETGEPDLWVRLYRLEF